jgi:chromosome segregation ATPase
VQLARTESERARILIRGNELGEQQKATEALLAAKAAELDRVQEENEQLRAQWEEAEREIEQHRAALGGLISSLRREVVCETDQIVLSGSRELPSPGISPSNCTSNV